MIEPIWHPFRGRLTPEIPDYIERRDEALIWRATNLAIESALSYGQDLPVGAATAQGHLINGRYFASDRRLGPGYEFAHAERMAVMEAQTMSAFYTPDTVAVTMEPCDDCQDFLATVPAISRVVFAVSREEVAEKGLVKPHKESIFERVKRLGYGFEPVLVANEQLRSVGGLVLDFVRRDLHSGAVSVDTPGLRDAITALNGPS